MTVLWRVLQMQVKLKEQGLSTKNISFSIYFENKLAKLRDAIANLKLSHLKKELKRHIEHQP